jgi:hypothetical protein
MRRWVSLAALVVGLVLLAGAGVVRWVVAPKLAVLPSNTDTTRTYTGTATTLFSGFALQHNVPVTLTHRTKVLDTNGDNALISDSGSIVANGSSVGGFHYRYAVDRTSMGPGTGFSGVVAQSGITFNFPIRTSPHNYPGWVSDTRSTVPLTYEGTATHGGLKTFVFHTESAPTAVTDPQTLKALPASLPKTLISRLAGSLGLSEGGLSALRQVLPSLPDPVRFNYTFRTVATYWVEPTTGEVVDLRERDVRTLALKVGNQVLPVTPVLDMTYTSSPSQLTAAVKQARHDAGQVDLVYRTVPLAALIAGLALMLGAGTGLVLLRRKPGRRCKATRASKIPQKRSPAAPVGRHRATVIKAKDLAGVANARADFSPTKVDLVKVPSTETDAPVPQLH